MLKSIILMVLTRCVVVFQNQDTPAKWLFDICSLMCWGWCQPQKAGWRRVATLWSLFGDLFVIFWGEHVGALVGLRCSEDVW